MTNKIARTLRAAFFPLAIIYMEAVALFSTCGIFDGWSVLYIGLFSVAAGFFINTVRAALRGFADKIVSIIFLLLLILLYGVQIVYYKIFRTFTVLSSVTRAGDVMTEFGTQALNGIVSCLPQLLALFAPLVVLVVMHGIVDSWLNDEGSRVKSCLFNLWVFVVVTLSTSIIIGMNTSGIMSYRYTYYNTFSPHIDVPRFGVLTTMSMDVRNMLIPSFSELGGDLQTSEQDDFTQSDSGNTPEDNENAQTDSDSQSDGDMNVSTDTADIDAEPETDSGEDTHEDTAEAETEVTAEPEPNVLEIDFDALIADETDSTLKDMHEYFSSLTPTMKNEYTGMFEGKNLIWIVAESFSRYALSEEYTPTLYKLANEGFVFENFYNPVWGVSTSDGEYVTLTGLIPKSGVWSFSRSSNNSMPFSFGNMLGALGYKTLAYHNNTYTYYDRDSSYPNMGYDYKGLGNGLNVTKVWPESDVEMMELTVDEYMGEEPFHVYYMTVSGHLEYNFSGNVMARRHMEEVQSMLDSGYSEGASAYVATQIEFNNAVQYLIDALDEAGILEDTVIVISGDHYPYGLENSEIEELAGEELDTTFELYRSTLIIWQSGMETVNVSKYCSSLDVMPTLANLFGLPYDSRLVMGSDILSDSPALVIFNDRSFITDYGRYSSRRDTFTPNEGVEVSDYYAADILSEVNDKFTYSALILDEDYYGVVLEE